MPVKRTQIRGVKDAANKKGLKDQLKKATKNAAKSGVNEAREEAKMGAIGFYFTKTKKDKNGVNYPADAAGKYEIANKKACGGKISRKFKCGGKLSKKC